MKTLMSSSPTVQTPSQDDVRRDLVAMLSHELRTPLTLVLGGYGLLADVMTKDASTEELSYLAIINQGITRLQRLFDEVSLYTELTSAYGEFQVQYESRPYDLRGIVDAAVLQVRQEFADRNVQFVVKSLPCPIYVLVVNILVQRAIYEVLRNAVMYSEPGATVFITLCQEDGITLEIQDEGWGVALEHQNLIWEPLIQSDRVRREQQGIGMGLPLVWQIIKRHHGEVRMRSQIGVGTTITLCFPPILAPV